jgi:Arc/MetJ-type ribon-helix-helix transcriptional regulator
MSSPISQEGDAPKDPVDGGTCYTDRMTTQVPVRLTNSDLAALDAAIARGRFANRSEALRAGLDRVLSEERQDEIDERYAVGYGRHPQKEWIGELGFAGLAGFDGAEGGPPL